MAGEKPIVSPALESHSAFFYGTLMAPSVLRRVTRGMHPTAVPELFDVRPAILPDHRRHRVRDADYPAIIPAAGSEVRGTFVTGLTDADIWRLDIFEGSEYERRKVKVSLLPEVSSEQALPPASAASKDAPLEEIVEAETYVWIAGKDELEDGEWDFAEFVKEKMWRWAGGHREDIVAVDEAVKQQETDSTRGRAVGGGFEEKVAGGS